MNYPRQGEIDGKKKTKNLSPDKTGGDLVLYSMHYAWMAAGDPNHTNHQSYQTVILHSTVIWHAMCPTSTARNRWFD